MNSSTAAAAQAAELSVHGALLLAFAVVVFALLIWDRLPIATVSLGALGAMTVGFALFPLRLPEGEVDPLHLLNGFGHPALVAICALMVLGHALVLTGALEPAARLFAAWVAAAPRQAFLALMVGAGAASGVLNDTPVVVLLIPLVIAAAARARAAPGAMLLPMNYAVLIGGMATTIGTSTNLIVVAIAADLGVGPFGVFSFYPLVALAAAPALVFLWLGAPYLLAHVQPASEELSEPVFDAELTVEPGSWLDGRELREAFSATGYRLNLVELRRDNRALTRLPSLKLRAGDRLHVQDTAANLKEAERSLRSALHGVELDLIRTLPRESASEPTVPASTVVAQMIVTMESSLFDRSVRQERIAERYGVVVVGLRSRLDREGWQREHPADRPLTAGDILLVQGRVADIQQAQRDGVGLLLDSRLALPRRHKAGIALWTMAAVVLLASTKVLPIAVAALGGVLFLLLTHCLSWQEVTHSLSVQVALLVVASLALGSALELTGATRFLAAKLAANTEGMSPAWTLALLMALMGLLTNLVSNNAAAAIGTPLAVELARAMNAPPEAFVLCVLFGCNLCYLTPMGYQTNLLVMNAGGYRFSDYLRVGAPLFLLMWAALSCGLVLRYAL